MPRDSHTITRFKGQNKYDSPMNVHPTYAISCRNVIADPGGPLQVARKTSTFIDFSDPHFSPESVSRILSLGVLDDETDGNVPRLVFQQGSLLFFADAPTFANPTQLTGTALDVVRLDYVQSSSVLYFSNGTSGGKLLPASAAYQNWGIAQATPPRLVASTSSLGSVTIQRTAGVTTVTFGSPHNSFIGDPVFVDSDPSATWPASFSGTFTANGRPSPNTLTYPNPGPDAGPFTRATFPGLTAATGYQYRVCLGNSKTGHWGTASAVSVATGPLTSQSPAIQSPAAADPQLDQAALFRNLDGGGDWLLVAIQPFPGTGPYPRQVTFLDTTTDSTLEASGQTPPYDNGVSPNGRYLCAHLDRILMAGIVGDEGSVAYSGYDSINFGRPQESWPQFNRIRIGQGESKPIGIGITQYGAVIFSTNQVMHIVRGTLTDITVSAVTPLSFTVRELPYQIGCYSHFAIQSSKAGITFLSDGLRLMNFDGYYAPTDAAPVLNGVLERITPGSQDILDSLKFDYLGRDWYVLSIPVDGSIVNNLTIIVDMSQDADRNTGAWVFDYSLDAMVNILFPDGTRHIVVSETQKPQPSPVPGAAGYISEVPFNFSNADTELMTGRYRTGYFGIKDEDGVDEWSLIKLFRYMRLVTALPGVKVRAYFVGGNNGAGGEYDFDNPFIQDFDVNSNYGTINVKARACSLELFFPDDVAAPILGLTMAWNNSGKR